jgi:hypothetical protein
MKLRNLLLTLLVALVALTGCKKESRPEGLPDLYPCSVKVIQGGAPLEGANVTLITNDSALMRWPCGGMTNAEGVAILNTYGFDGAPAGQFQVTIAKTISEGGAATQEEAAQNMRDGVIVKETTIDLVDPVYKNQRTTPLTLEVQASKTNPVAEFDVGEEVREIVIM